EQQGGRLGNLVIFNEEFLELVNDQERAGNGLGSAGPFESGNILDAESAEQVAPALQFIIQALEDAQSEFPVAFDGDDARMREAMSGVAFELDTFLEVDEVK